MGILRGQGLYKEIDNGIQLRYVYQKDNIKPLAQRFIVLIISISIYINSMEKTTNVYGLPVIAILFIVNYFFPINRGMVDSSIPLSWF
jgi:hypothetical protein